MIEQAQGEILERLPGDPPEESAPERWPAAGKPAKPKDVRVGHGPAPSRGPMADDAEEAHQREEGLAGDLARAERPVKVELREGLGRGGQAEGDLAVGHADADE